MPYIKRTGSHSDDDASSHYRLIKRLLGQRSLSLSNCSDWGRKRRDFVSLSACFLQQILILMMMMMIRSLLLLLLLTFVATTAGVRAGSRNQVSTRKYFAPFNYFYKLFLLFIRSVLV